MIDTIHVNDSVFSQPFPFALTPSLSHDNQPYFRVRRFDRHAFGKTIQSFDSGGNKYV